MAGPASVAAFSCGIAAHLLFFKTDERFLYPFRYVQAIILGVAIATVAQTQYGEVPLGQSFRDTLRYTGVALAGVFSSLLTYRLFFNPLNRFPGPFFARISKFDHVFRNANMKGHHELHRLHQKYGKFVRVGPNDLSVIDADGTQVVSAPNSKCYKAPWYAQDSPFISMHTTRDRAFHDRRRRVWAPAFSDKALRGYEARVQKYNDLLVSRMEDQAGTPVDVSKWFNLYSFDAMGELGFGKSFDMLQSGETHWAIKLLGAGMDPLAFGFPTWFFRALVAIPGLSAEYHRFIGYCTNTLDNRMKQGKAENPDIIQTLIDQYEVSENKKEALPLIQGDSRLIIVAGSDTTAASLVHLFYWLAKKPDYQKRLRDELKTLGQNNGQSLQHRDIMDSELLNGLINESLRLNPPVPSGVFRKTPKEGVNIGKTFVPGDTVIQMPTYAMGHNEDNFAQCEEFIPERFYSQPELIKHKDAWNPFSSGPFGCIGRNLAYMEIRTVTAQLIQKFNVTFAPGEDGSGLMKNSRDHFTMELAEMNLVFTPI